MTDLTKEELDELDEVFGSWIPNSVRGIKWDTLLNMARRSIELEARVKELETRLDKAQEYLANAKAGGQRYDWLEAKVQVLTACLETRQEALQLTQDESYAKGVRVQELEAETAHLKRYHASPGYVLVREESWDEAQNALRDAVIWEAQAAAMREALELADELQEASYMFGEDRWDAEKASQRKDQILAKMHEALSGDAGKALLERLKRYKAGLIAIRDYKPTDDIDSLRLRAIARGTLEVDGE